MNERDVVYGRCFCILASALALFTAAARAEPPAAQKTAAAAASNVFASGSAAPATAAKEKAALAAAGQWLAMVDKGTYADAWQGAAEYFRSLEKQKPFEQRMQTARGPLGKLVSRKLARSVYRTKLADTPEGEYVVMKFDAAFEKKPSAVETVTAMADKDGQWRVTGYFINVNQPRASVPQEPKK